MLRRKLFEKQQFRFDGNKCFDKKFICCFDGDDNLRDQHFAFDDFRKFDKSKDFGHFDKKKKTALNAKSNANPLSLTVPKSPSVVCSPLYAAVSSLLRVGKQRLVQKGLQTAAPSLYIVSIYYNHNYLTFQRILNIYAFLTFNLIYIAYYRLGGYREAQAFIQLRFYYLKRHHAYNLPVDIKQRPARIARVYCGIGLYYLTFL